MSRVAIKEESLLNLANLARQTAKTTDTYDIDEAVDILKEAGSPPLEELTATDNGEYTPTAYGYSKVTVDVQPETEELTVTTNGEYIPSTDGYSRVTVNCPPAPTDEELVVTGSCLNRFAYDGWNWVIDKYRDRITTKDISSAGSMFTTSKKLEKIPFQINVTDAYNFDSMFNYCTKLSECPKIRGTITWNTSTTFSSFITNCQNLRDVEDLFTPEMLDGFATVKVTSAYSCPKAVVFNNCHSLRQLPSWWYKFKLNPESTAFPSSSYTLYYSMLSSCYTLDEALNIPVWKCLGAATSGLFSYAFDDCRRAKNITFETNPDGTPIEANWKSQTIDLTKYVGYHYATNSIAQMDSAFTRKTYTDYQCYNSGITEDKLIYNDATYQLLKDDPDSFALDCGSSTIGGSYSRYNHDSAVNTINSLPDTSAYLATAGGTNTIKFKGASGSKTDGGAINTLTETEIAIATAKGWTVTFA